MGALPPPMPAQSSQPTRRKILVLKFQPGGRGGRVQSQPAGSTGDQDSGQWRELDIVIIQTIKMPPQDLEEEEEEEEGETDRAVKMEGTG